MAGAHHRTAQYARDSRTLRNRANTNPATLCWRCRHTLATCGPHGNGTHRNGTPAVWHAGHIRDGDPTSPLAAECSPCNTRAGAIAGNQRREPHTENW